MQQSEVASLLRDALTTKPFTWDALGPADGDHYLSIKKVAECGHSREVSVRAGWIRHGIQLLRLNHQQMRHQSIHWGYSDRCRTRVMNTDLADLCSPSEPSASQNSPLALLENAGKPEITAHFPGER